MDILSLLFKINLNSEINNCRHQRANKNGIKNHFTARRQY
jgi:hypothetical protein